jgi:hypothetical protein
MDEPSPAPNASDPSNAALKAALLALGFGLAWLALAPLRRKRPSTPW